MKAEGILLVNKPKGKTSFSLIAALRKILGEKKIGHAGTLDPMATGVMVLLIGKKYTTLSEQFLGCDKEYRAEITLGQSTDSYDAEGTILSTSSTVPTLQNINKALLAFQGWIKQIPPMFSAKKIRGLKLYQYARQGITVERAPVDVCLTTSFIQYHYPKIELLINCSKGTYIRSIAHSLGEVLECGGHLSSLVRTKSGAFTLEQCMVDGETIFNLPLDEAKVKVLNHLIAI